MSADMGADMGASSARRRWWTVLAAMCIVGGLVAALVLWNGASQRRSTAIENFARAPIGCDTTLDFVEPGEYLIFVETNGNLDGVRGDCDVEGPYDNADRDVPDVEITLVDPDGNEIDLDRSFGDIEYDAAGFRGVALRSVDIEETNDHVLRAQSDAEGVFVVAVGRDPDEGVATLRAGSIAAGLIGVLAGLALFVAGKRRPSAAMTPGPWTTGAPAQPPTFMPGAQPPQGPPAYGQPTGPPQFDQSSRYGQPTGPPQFDRSPQYGQPTGPSPYGQSPQYGQSSQYGQPSRSQPPAPDASQRVPDNSDTFGRSSFSQTPTSPPDSSHIIDWAPPPPSPTSSPDPDSPDSGFFGPRPGEPSAQDRPPLPPPE